jgi:hypothetical protein
MPSNQKSLAQATHQQCLQLDQEGSLSFFVSCHVLAAVEKRVAGADPLTVFLGLPLSFSPFI